VKFSNFIRLRRFAIGCCCEVIRSFFRRFCVILIELSYSDHVSYISFIFLRLPFCHEIHPIFYGAGSVFKCQQLPNNNKAGKMSERRKEKCHTEKFLKENEKKKKFSVTKLLCCHVDGEKLYVPHFPKLSAGAERRQKLFCHFGHYLLIYHYN
jgi:hypothetical protein